MAKTLIIMAAGMGSRFGGDKQIANIGPSGEILMEYSVYDAIQTGFDRIVFVIRDGMQSFFDELIAGMRQANSNISFFYVVQSSSGNYDGINISPQRKKPLGTVHAILSAGKYLDSHFAAINADDYYGRGAFKTLSESIDKFSCKEASLITYSLSNTLSAHGAVTRGICEVRDGVLENIREVFKVMKNQEGLIIEADSPQANALDPKTPVSMNMWAFSSSCVPSMKEYFRAFLSKLEADDNKSECILPNMVHDLMNSGELKIKTYHTDERWFGITYKADSVDAAWELDKRHEAGIYPQKLFRT